MSAHPDYVAHHFDDAEQQYEASQLGMWLFLATEVLFFGGLFLGYAVYRTKFPEAFVVASSKLDIRLGAFNTIVLLTSSLTVVLAVHSARTGNSKRIVQYLLATIGLGLVFFAVKAVEYSHKFHEHLVPGPYFQFAHLPEGMPEGNVQLFFSFYFAMTGMHALHMIIGVVVIAVIAYLASKGNYTPEYYTPVDMVGLYWHFVDIVWVFLFPFLYLIG